MKFVILLSCLLCPLGAIADCGESTPAMVYLRHIESMRWQDMRSMLADDARYSDPTMIYFDRPAIDLSGADAIVAFWRSASEESGTSSIQYNVKKCFETAGYYVVHLEIAVGLAGAFWNVAKDSITVEGGVTSVIRIRDGKIVEHDDYVDYAGALRFIDQLRNQYGAADPAS